MKRIAIFWLLILCGIICLRAEDSATDLGLEKTNMDLYESFTSPSRKFIAMAGVGIADVSPSIRMRLRVLVLELSTCRVQQILPWVQGPCVAVWAQNDVLVICGRSDQSDEKHEIYEISAHQFRPFLKVEHRKATEDEKKLIQAAFFKKYGREAFPVTETVRAYDAFSPS